MTSPWLSVLMPTYNGGAYLRAALESVAAEGDPDVECIAVDDGSTDDTLAILDSYRDRLALEIVERRHAGNWVANTNIALEQASGEFTCLLHQDDIWLPGRPAALTAAIASHPTVDLFLHPAWFIDANGRQLGKWRCPLPADPAILDADTVLPRLLVQNFIAIPAPMFRTAAARAAGGLDEALWYTADWDFWLKLAAAGRTVYRPEPLAGFRVHPASQTHRRSIDIDDFGGQQAAVLDRYLPQLSGPDRDRQATSRIARVSVAVNMALAGRYHNGRWADLPNLLAMLVALGPAGWSRYLRHSRILERVWARLLVGRGTGRSGIGDSDLDAVKASQGTRQPAVRLDSKPDSPRT